MHARAGFTIIEVLIVTLISALLAGVLFTSFWQTQRLEQVIDDLITDDQTITRLYNQFEKDVNGFFIPALNLIKPPPAAPSEQKLAPGQIIPAADKAAEQQITKLFVSTTKNKMLNLLTFTSNNVLAVYKKQKPLVARVVYRLEPSKKFEGTFALTRQELNTLDAKAMEEKNKQTQAYIIADSISSLVLTYVYAEFEAPPKPGMPPLSGVALAKSEPASTQKEEPKKVTEWDSDAITKNKESKQPLIPDMVKMQLVLRNAMDGTTNQFNFTFPLVIAPGIEQLLTPPPPPPPPPPPAAPATQSKPVTGAPGTAIGSGLPSPKSSLVIVGGRG